MLVNPPTHRAVPSDVAWMQASLSADACVTGQQPGIYIWSDLAPLLAMDVVGDTGP